LTKKLRPIRFLIRALLYLTVAWALGFFLFLARLPDPLEPIGLKADAIVVLTGGKGRLEAGIGLLQNGSAKRLLISGVHPDVLKNELIVLTGANPALFDCCIDLDYAAGNTSGNALETAHWAKKNGFKQLILVTADYHIQRSGILFRHALPDVEITSYPVAGDVGILMLAREYSKYIVTLFQKAFSSLRNPERPS